MQAIGIDFTREMFEQFWKTLFQPIKKLANEGTTKIPGRDTEERKNFKPDSINKKNRPRVEAISYQQMLQAFVDAECIKFEKSSDKKDTLMSKFRQQLRRKNLTAEKAFREYDFNNCDSVYRNQFIDVSFYIGLEFSEDELTKIFKIICEQCTERVKSTNQQDQVNQRVLDNNNTRITYVKFDAALNDRKDERWENQAYIKINSRVIQQKTSYKSLFIKWRPKGSKTPAGKLNKEELKEGLKKLKAGLTNEEIVNLCAKIVQNDGKEQTISDVEFKKQVLAGASALKKEKMFERMMLATWIEEFNEQIKTNNFPFDIVIQEFDSEQQGGLTFQDFCNLNEFLKVNLSRKDLKSVFGIIDNIKSGKLSIDQIRTAVQMTLRLDAEDMEEGVDVIDVPQEDLKGEELMIRQETNLFYEEIKSKLEVKGLTLQAVFFGTGN